MSQFLPEPRSEPIRTPAPPPGIPDERTREQIKKLFGSPNAIPEQFWAYAWSLLEANQPQIPVSQIFGFQKFINDSVVAADPISTLETTSSTSYGDLATVGPQLTGLADGRYAVFFGATASLETYDVDASIMCMALSANGSGSADSQGALWASFADATAATDSRGRVATPGARMVVGVLDNGDANTLTAKYRWERTVDGGAVGTSGPGSFSNRWLVALRTGNE